MDQKKDILYIGMALVDSIVKEFDPVPISASGYRAVSGSLHAGGEAVNGSVAASKLGLSVSILCALGNDEAGQIVVNTLIKNGVDIQYIKRVPDHKTPITTMLVEKDGSRRSITNHAHMYNFHPERFTDIIRDKKIVVLSSLFRAPFDDAGIIYKVIKAAKDRKALVFADTKIPNFAKIGLSDIDDSLSMIDYIFPNEDEAKHFTGKEDPDEMAEVFLEHGVSNVIIKTGEKGSFFKNSKERIITRSFSVDAVDATGAGDNFIAGFAREILVGKDHEHALEIANACGAISTTKEGAHAGLKNYEQVESFVKEKSR